MSFPISLEQPEYEALVEFARRGTLDHEGRPRAEDARLLEAFLVSIEKKSGIQRYTLWVQWQETAYPLPPGTRFPEKWPPELREQLTLTSRPIAKSDVTTLLANRAKSPVTVLVTADPAGLVGWSQLNEYFK